CFFFLHRPYLQYLLSFPTRRSSDLTVNFNDIAWIKFTPAPMFSLTIYKRAFFAYKRFDHATRFQYIGPFYQLTEFNERRVDGYFFIQLDSPAFIFVLRFSCAIYLKCLHIYTFLNLFY